MALIASHPARYSQRISSMWHRIFAGFTLTALLCAASSLQADVFWGNTYWAYTYKSFDVVAAGTQAYAENMARNLERFELAFTEVTKLKLGDWRPTTHVYAIESSVFKQVWPNPTPLESAYNTSEFDNDIIINNEGEVDNRYRGVFFGYGGSLMNNEGLMQYPSWYRQGVAELFAATQERDKEVTIGSYSQA